MATTNPLVVPASPEKILVPALAKLQKDSTGRYGNALIKKEAEDALAKLSELHGSADAAFPALHAACASKTPKYVVTALDCMEKLLSYKFLGNTTEMAAKVVRAISACSEQPDDGVQLQVVKALCTAVTAADIAHEQTLLLALRACYHIHLVSDNPTNRTTSKVILTQMMSAVFAAVESAPVVVVPVVTPIVTSTPPPIPVTVVTPPAAPVAVPALPMGDSMYPSVQMHLGFYKAQEPVLVAAMEQPLASTNPNDATSLGPVTVTPPLVVGEEEESQQAGFNFASPAHKDAFLVLRTLSKLSMKAISFEDLSSTGDEGKADPRALKSKLLSLELLASILENAGPQLKSSDAIVFAIKQYLIPALMKNCMEVNTQVASVAMRVFELVQSRFKDQLKKEIELLISNVFLGLLSSPHASFESQLLVLDTFNHMCSNVQTMVEIFLNYDCDWNSRDLLKQISEQLCNTALTRMTKDGESEKLTEVDLAHCRKLRVRGTEALAALAKAMSTYATMAGKEEDVATAATATAALATSSEGGGNATTNSVTMNEDPTEMPDKVDKHQATKLASAALDAFQLKKTWKRDLDAAVLKFNEKPKDGIKYLRERGHLDETPASVAKFLYEHSHLLSKTMIGDYLGDNHEQNVKVLFAYTELFHFKGFALDEAIREFLAHFRIPGEAQKIDRVMEMFASQYWSQNQEVFPSADTAFILSYAIIMLQTDAHNPNIKPEKRMKKSDFLKNNRGIASGRDLAPEYLGGIYDRIVAKAISLKGDDIDYTEANNAVEYVGDAKGRRKAFFKERAEILSGAEQKRKGGNPETIETDTSMFFMVEHSFATMEHVGPMFQVVWKPMATAFRANLLNTDEPEVASMCLDGLYNAIRVAGRFHLDDERASLIETLANLTRLEFPAEVEPKNVMCIQALMALAVSEGNYLGTSWDRVLQCASEVYRLLMMSPSGEDDSIPNEHEASGGPPNKKRLTVSAIDQAFKATVALKRVLDFASVDRIFVRSVNLNETAIVDFVNALTEVARSELLLKNSNGTSTNGGGGGVASKTSSSTLKRSTTSGAAQSAGPRARLFSLQKIVEVADFNLPIRTRFTWGRIWSTVSELFVAAGCHPLTQVAMYAVDSLKQLSIKFLRKDEFVGFAFQDRFLRPFEPIVRNAASPDVRALVLHCMHNFLAGSSKAIKSGWGAVFDVIAGSARDPVQENVQLGLSLLEMAQPAGAPAFLFAQCSLKFASAEDVAISEKCLGFVEAYANASYLTPEAETQQNEDDDSPKKARELLKGLANFSATDPRDRVRLTALTFVFTILRNALEDMADAGIVAEICEVEVFSSWTFDMKTQATLLIPSSSSPGKWATSTLAFAAVELVRYLALALYDLDVPACTPEEFARVRSADDPWPAAPTSKKLGGPNPGARESAFRPLFVNALKFLKVCSKNDVSRTTAVVGVASLNYLLDITGPLFCSESWILFLETAREALGATSPAFLNSSETLKKLGLLDFPSHDDDETRVKFISLDDLDSEDGVVMPASSPIGLPKPTAITPVAVPAVDLKAAELRSVSNTSLIKMLCRVVRKPGPLDSHNASLLSMACDYLEHGLKDASAFDDNHVLRIDLSKRGYVKEGSGKPPKEGIVPPPVPPDALEVEVIASTTLLRLIQSKRQEEEPRFERVLVALVNRYLRQDRVLAAEQTLKPRVGNAAATVIGTMKSETEKELGALTPVVLLGLRGVLELESKSAVDRALPWSFPLLLQLIECPNRDVRAIVRRILEKHVSGRLGF